LIVPDGRTDLEKLKELLGNPEQTHLDLKASVDLTNAADKLKFVKDAVTMASRPEGGYILMGVDDAGAPCLPVGTITDRARFDGSRVGALIRSYVEAAVHVVVEIHELANHEIVVIYVRNPDGLPVPFNKDGQHPGPAAGDKDVTVFRKGEIFVREGAENVPIRTPIGPTCCPFTPAASVTSPPKPRCRCCVRSSPVAAAPRAALVFRCSRTWTKPLSPPPQFDY